MKIVLVYNPKSGSALTSRQLRGLCQQHDITIEKLVALDKDDAWKQKLAPFIKKGATIATYGGDGTLSAVAGLLVNTKAIFVPLPGGTLNHFTKDLGIPQIISQALAHLKRASVRTVDIAKVNERIFINNASIGLYPLSLRERSRFEDHLGKWPAALIAGVRALIRFRLYSVTIGNENFRTPFIFIGNNKYTLNGVEGVRRQRIDQGVLSVYIIRTASRFTLLKIVLLGLVKRARYLNEFEAREVKKLTIETRHPHLSVSHDGEVSKMNSPLYFELLKGVLRIRS